MILVIMNNFLCLFVKKFIDVHDGQSFFVLGTCKVFWSSSDKVELVTEGIMPLTLVSYDW